MPGLKLSLADKQPLKTNHWHANTGKCKESWQSHELIICYPANTLLFLFKWRDNDMSEIAAQLFLT